MKKLKLPILFLVLTFLVLLTGCDSTDYQKAQELLNTGDYEGAYEAFVALEDYQDSRSKADECIYHMGVACLNAGDYDSAITYLEGINYKDSAELLNKATDIKNYETGKQAFENGDYDTTIKYLKDLNYKDSKAVFEQATKEKGMHENDDYAFLEDLEAAITKRMEINSQPTYTNSDLVESDRLYLRKHISETYFDERIEKLANLYWEGTELQNASLTENHADSQRHWNEGVLKRMEALNTLYMEYGFMSENDEFVLSYVDDYEKTMTETKAIITIMDDLDPQIYFPIEDKSGEDTVMIDVNSNGSWAFHCVNNTDFSYDVCYFWTGFYNLEYSVLQTDSTTSRINIAPHTSFDLTGYVDVQKLSAEGKIVTDYEIGNVIVK